MASRSASLPRWQIPLSSLLLSLLLLLCSLACFPVALAVKHENFKTCAQSGFCTRNRAYADDALGQGASWASPYELDSASVTLTDGVLRGIIHKRLTSTDQIAGSPSDDTLRLPLTVAFLESGLARVTIDEEARQKGDIELRHGSQARKERYNEVDKWVLVGGLKTSGTARLVRGATKGASVVEYGDGRAHRAVIRHAPFGIEFQRDGETQIKFNERGLMSVEHWRRKVEREKKEGGEEEVTDVVDESTWWEESFGGNTDSKPRGPESVGLDITFPGYEHVFGIPEHTGPMSLKQTRGGEGQYTEPYRLYNADVFEYIMDSPMTLYGSIPLMQAHKVNSTVAVFWLNAAETWVDITKSTRGGALGIGGATDTQTHWFSESGLLDVFVLLGPSPLAINRDYAALTGTPQLPAQFAIAHHQCRWNYVTDTDVRDVDRKFDKHALPYDVIWLDIEYTDGKKYFTWDPLTFPDPLGMQSQLDEHGRKLVVIIDPHIKKEAGYAVVDELQSQGLSVMNKEAVPYEGWCWPGASLWIDAFNPAALAWWKTLFTYARFAGTASNAWLWNDMNEPSVFNGPETTMPKDNLHHGGWEHRDVHNLNGLTFHNATFEALLARDASFPSSSPDSKSHSASVSSTTRRPFVLTRAFFAGSQRLGAMWTGDNQASWPHLAASIPMVLSLNTAGFPFAGADVGGFFGNPDRELLARWYQAGAFYPFFRAHAHIDTRRREPYLGVDEPARSAIAQALRLRYALLPAWYTAFHDAATHGGPVVRPQWHVHPLDAAGFALDDQLHLGDTGLLFKPAVAAGVTSVDVHLADARTYYDYHTFAAFAGPAGRSAAVPAALPRLPLLMRAGHIFARRDRPRRSSGLMQRDPLTLVVVLEQALGRDGGGDAAGALYLDDGATHAFRAGACVRRALRFDAAAAVLRSREADADAGGCARGGEPSRAYRDSLTDVRVQEVVLVGVPRAWEGRTRARVVHEDVGAGRDEAREVQLTVVPERDGAARWAVVRLLPGLGVARDWRIEF